MARGEIHAILGENGAGKSTLVKIVAGVVERDSGEIRLEGRVFDSFSRKDARAAGIAVVYQELSLIPQLSVAHNLSLARLPRRGGLVSLRRARRFAEEVLAGLGLDRIDPRATVAKLSLDQQQMLEVAKATVVRPRMLILDEATSSLGSAEVDRLFELVRSLSRDGTTVLVITHRMSEVWALARSTTILRDGRTVGRFAIDEISQNEAIRLMAGRDVQTIFPGKRAEPVDRPALELRDVRLRQDRPPWNLTLRRGEILGVGGLEGQGQRELLAWLYGSGAGTGTVVRDGVPLRIRRPVDALRQGIVLIPEDRKGAGLHLDLPVRWNLAMATLGKRQRAGVIRMRAEKRFAAATIEQLAIRLSSPFQLASTSERRDPAEGRHRQVHGAGALGAALRRHDDGASTCRRSSRSTRCCAGLARDGAACVLYSSDTEELVGLCDRVAVFHDAAPEIILEGDEITQDAVVAASFAGREGGELTAVDRAPAGAAARPAVGASPGSAPT